MFLIFGEPRETLVKDGLVEGKKESKERDSIEDRPSFDDD
jgi:hypothetical protein